MPKKQIIIIVVAAIIIIAGIILLAGKSQQTNQQTNNLTGEEATQEAPKSLTREDVLENIKIPEAGEQTSGGIAAPISVSPAAPETGAFIISKNFHF